MTAILDLSNMARHRGSPSWLPREIGRRWSYLPLVQQLCLWNDFNNYLIKPISGTHVGDRQGKSTLLSKNGLDLIKYMLLVHNAYEQDCNKSSQVGQM